MKPEKTQKEQTYERILEAAGKSFRKGGYNGIGVDGLAKEAGVTSGAFYGHFNSKMAAFEASITSGLGDFKTAIADYQSNFGDAWWQEFSEFYMGEKRNCSLAHSCSLQSLTAEVMRSDERIREVFESELIKIAKLMGKDNVLAGEKRDFDETWGNLAMLIGGVTLARAVKSPELANEIANAIQHKLTASK